jgi:NitT/TauT family transport system permease protein
VYVGVLAQGKRSGRARSLLGVSKSTWLGGLSVLGGLVLWELYARTVDTFIPPFSDVVSAWTRMIASGELIEAFAGSAQAFFIGFSLAIVVALAVGIVLGTNAEADHTAAPFLSALIALPSVAYIPLIMIWFGFGLAGRVAIVFEFSVLVMTMNVRAGVRGVDHDLLQMARAFSFGRWRTFRNVVVPGAMPGIMAGLRLGLGRAIKGTVTAEVLLVLVGVGGLVKSYGNTFRLDALLAVVATIVAIALILTSVLLRIDRRLNRWQAASARGPRT